MRKHLTPGPFVSLFFLLAFALLVGFVIFTRSLRFQSSAPNGEGVVALTGGPERIEAAVALLVDGHSHKLLISGVNPATTNQELARHIPDYLKLEACCIQLGYAAKNTIGNANETSRWVKAQGIHKSLIVVTSYYHMPRALLEIGHAVPSLKLLPYPVSRMQKRDQIWTDPATLRIVSVEYLKFIGVWLRLNFFSGTATKPEAADLRPSLAVDPAKTDNSTQLINLQRD